MFPILAAPRWAIHDPRSTGFLDAFEPQAGATARSAGHRARSTEQCGEEGKQHPSKTGEWTVESKAGCRVFGAVS
jgi:hypothetical protein